MPDQYEKDLMACVHCGICLSACPTYLETGSEADSPRGRIVLMRGMHDGTLSPADPDVVRHIDLCLGCRACETACPSKVPYGNLLELARERIHEAGVRSPRTALSRKALLATMTNPPAMAVAMQASHLLPGGQGNVPAFAMRLLSGDAEAAGQPVIQPDKIAHPLPPVFTPAVGGKRYRVGVLAGCVMRVLYGDVNADTVRVLAANGCEVLVNRRQACCGALHLHNGYGDEARAMARRLIDAFTPFDGLDAIVVNSAGCASTMKEYGALLADDAAYSARAEAFAAKVRDVSEYLDKIGWIAPLQHLSEDSLPFREGVGVGSDSPSPFQGEGRGEVSVPLFLEGRGVGERGGDEIVVAYHDACHLAHAQQVRAAPRRLLAKIPGVKFVPLAESEICCGSAGIYNLTEPDMATRLQARKVDNVLKTGASIVVTGNPGCLAWIDNGLRQRGLSHPRVVHPVTLLAAALKEV